MQNTTMILPEELVYIRDNAGFTLLGRVELLFMGHGHAKPALLMCTSTLDHMGSGCQYKQQHQLESYWHCDLSVCQHLGLSDNTRINGGTTAIYHFQILRVHDLEQQLQTMDYL